MKLNYINKIKANISIYSSKKTTNILDGTYKSVYKGKSLNFENLREYVINDDVKDIDWKSSARSGTLLVKQFIAEKKHNIMLIMDTGKKMDADTDKHESKKEIALYTAGTIGYLAIKNNDYDKYANVKDIDMNELLEYVFKNISKRMIIFIITDIAGIDDIKSSTLKKLNQRHDLMIININDNYMFGKDIFDVSEDEYISDFLLNDSKLNEVEQEVRKDILKKNLTKLKKNNTCVTSISSKEEINLKIIELLEEHRYASNN